MKKIIDWIAIVLIILFGLCAFSCDNLTEEEKHEHQKQEECWRGFNVIVIDSCEYLIKKEQQISVQAGWGWGYMAHKGNCKFCAERNKNK